MYVSHASGNDSWSCDQSTPCKTIWRAVTLASRGDRIHLDGTNTVKHPYTCQSGTSAHPGIYINRSLSLIGYASPMPQIRCPEGTGLTFNGSDHAEQMNVTLSGLLVNESFVSVQDSFVSIDGCKFQGSKQGVEFVMRNKMASNIRITNSTFSRNRMCISVVVNSTENPSQNIQVEFKLTNSSFDSNVLSDEGTSISFSASPHNNQSVSCGITLENVTFSRNTFSSRGLVFLEMENGSQNIHLQGVSFIDNNPSSGQDVFTAEGVSECIVRSTNVNIFIDSSNFTTENARAFNVSASSISLQIHNSSFFGHRAKGKGGVISLRGTDVCKVNVSNSSFVNTTAGQGGAINIECSSVDTASFEENVFTNNTATQGGGGAVYVYSPGSFSNDSEYSTDDKADVGYRIDGEKLLQINITRCGFTSANSSYGGGAIHIMALKASMQLRHSTFINCTGTTGGVIINTSLTSPNKKPGNDLLMIVESSRFIRCKSLASDDLCGSMHVLFQTQVRMTISNSHFIANDGAAFVVYSSIDPTNASSYVKIEHSTISYNTGLRVVSYIKLSNQSIIILENVTMESNSVRDALHIGTTAFVGSNCTLKIRQSRFLKNRAHSCGGALVVLDADVFEVQDSLFESNNAWEALSSEPQGIGGALCIMSDLISTSILIFNTTFNNCSTAQYGGAIYLFHGGNLSLEVKKSRFVDNRAEFGRGGAVSLLLAPDTEIDSGCIKERLSTASQSDNAKEFHSWVYKSHVLFEDTTFERNAGYAGGAVYLTNGTATFRNCHFIDNFAATQGGHIYTVPGSASLIIQDSVFRQTRNKLPLLKVNYTEPSFVYSESSGALKLYNTSMDATPYGGTSPLMLVRNGRQIDVGNANLTTFICPVGSQMEIVNFTNQVTARVNNTATCKIEVTTLQFSCSACTGYFYSLQRGRAIGSQLASGFQCLPCPFGANCSQNIHAKPNFWGFKEIVDPPTLKFTMCPLGYCSSQETVFPEYNGCQGNRSGELCGQCNESFTATLYSTNCRPSHECRDYWFWPVALVFVSLMALYFTFKPPVVSWMTRQILWFKHHEHTSEDNTFDKGYLKVIFYFYQAANLLLVFNSSQHIFESKLIEPLVGLFSFQPKFSSGGLICPFPGLTVVTKQLFSASHVFGTLLMIGIFYILHWGIQNCRDQGVPSVDRYIGSLLQTMLLGYTTLASVSFNLLRCVPIGSEKRLFYDGNVVCFQWWQYVLIAFICMFFVPFVFTLLWGSFKLHNRTISMGEFLLACSLPLPYFLYWTFICLFCRPRNTCAGNEDSPSSQMSRSSVERVLYDSFKRPEDGGKLSLSWESVMIGRRLILIVLKAFVSDPMPRLLLMSFCCFLFLLHHALTQPFRDGIVNAVETISLLSLGLLAIVNVFFASFLSFAIPLTDNFTSWLSVCQVVEIVILCAVPAVFGLLVVAAVLSQVCRLAVAVCRFLFHLFCVCFSWCSRKQDDKMRPLLAPVS